MTTLSTLPETPDAIRVVAGTRRRMLWEAMRTDVIFAPWIPPFLLPILALLGVHLVSDLFDPVELELVGSDQLGSLGRLTELQLRFADLIVCGAQRQAERLQSKASELKPGRLLPVLVVPFGIPAPPPKADRHPLRQRLDLRESHKVILWWGSPWRWLDPLTAIRAVVGLGRSDVCLVFTAGPPPDPKTKGLVQASEARRLAAKIGALDRTIYFIEDWIPYEDRAAYLQDADIGICLNSDSDEGTFAVRARYFDYLWCRLPCVLSGGDELADELAEEGFAHLVDLGDVESVERALEGLLSDRDLLRASVAGGEAIAQRYSWDTVVEPIVGGIDRLRPTGAARRARKARKSLVLALAFYVERLKLSLDRRARRRFPRVAGRRASSRIRA